MNRKMKLCVAILLFILYVVIGNWPGGSNIKDNWDNLMNWVNGNKEFPKKSNRNK